MSITYLEQSLTKLPKFNEFPRIEIEVQISLGFFIVHRIVRLIWICFDIKVRTSSFLLDIGVEQSMSRLAKFDDFAWIVDEAQHSLFFKTSYH